MNAPFPCLWFEGNAKEAADYYCSIFKNSFVISHNQLVVIFNINGQKFLALNGNPAFQFNQSVSFVVECETQEEIDHYWERLTDEGIENMCGWLTDKYGISWQIVPASLGKLMGDSERSEKVTTALLKMNKLIMADLENA